MRLPLLLAVVFSSTVSCRAPQPPSEAELEARIRADAVTVVSEDSFTLFSPYDVESTRPYVDAVREEASLVRRLFADTNPVPPRVHLVPLESPDGTSSSTAWQHASHDGVEGVAFETGFVIVFVTAGVDASVARMQAELGHFQIRHELAHLHARRAGWTRARWFNEGLARDVEYRDVDGSTLRPRSIVPGLVDARRNARPGTVRELLEWNEHGVREGVTDTLYDESQALFRFLIGRQTDGDWLHRVATVHAMRDQEIVELESEWLAWLASFDALAAIRAGARSASQSERARSASYLPILAERGAPELATLEADALALELLEDPRTCEPAAGFLLYFRAQDLSADCIATLCDSDRVVPCLTGLALRAKRGEPFDARRVRDAWRRATAQERSNLEFQRSLLRLSNEREPGEALPR